MTFTKEVTLWCDGGCSEWIQLNNYESKGGRVSAARVYARRLGWTYVRDSDFCRAHSTFHAKIVPDPVFDGPTVSLSEIGRA